MNVLVIGSGGREHALCWKLAQGSRLTKLYCTPGNAGIAQVAECVPLDITDNDALVKLAGNLNIDLTIVGPEQPLVAGVVDAFNNAGLRIVGPTAAAAQLEGSKIFSKEFMTRHGIPTGNFVTCDSSAEARDAISSGTFDYPIVIKADGLAAGKGVVIASNSSEAESAISEIMDQHKLGTAGDRVLIEECLVGREASYLLFSDGNAIRPMVAAQDYKRAFDNDKGPNTGGMGTFSMPRQLDPLIEDQILKEIAEPTINAARAEGFPFRGVLFIGLMLTADGPRVLEYNVRFGDPETQSILKRLDSDLLDIFDAIETGTLDNVEPQWSNDVAVCIVAASEGYPGDYEKGKLISGLEDAGSIDGVTVFHAGTKRNGDDIVSSGGRVLGVTARSNDLKEARDLAYQAIRKIHFNGMFYRSDIAAQ
ncbi:MAG TPA: phosphoribosylamine--glycine ligase [Blastocatellia bacterium]|nr:phosphoribosylamine--glycine ligase [Blastocatellia bacterium]